MLMKTTFLIIFTALLFSFQTKSLANNIEAKTTEQTVTLLSINTASAKDLATLKGIGLKKAQAIVNYRENNGAYQSVEELLKVKGIGKKVLLDNKAKLSI